MPECPGCRMTMEDLANDPESFRSVLVELGRSVFPHDAGFYYDMAWIRNDPRRPNSHRTYLLLGRDEQVYPPPERDLVYYERFASAVIRFVENLGLHGEFFHEDEAYFIELYGDGPVSYDYALDRDDPYGVRSDRRYFFNAANRSSEGSTDEPQFDEDSHVPEDDEDPDTTEDGEDPQESANRRLENEFFRRRT
jgi:hypothetical protein